jgi:hypothetical protein
MDGGAITFLHIFRSKERTMNWPTAFVISTVVVASAFLYSERSDAGRVNGGGDD